MSQHRSPDMAMVSRASLGALVAIDPGLGPKLAWAVFQNGRYVIHGCGEKHPGPLVIGCHMVTVVIEKPTIYPDQKKKVDPGDLLSIFGEANLLAGSLASRTGPGSAIYWVEPRTWKRQLKKEHHHAIAASRGAVFGDANEDERDAICLGMWALGRLTV